VQSEYRNHYGHPSNTESARNALEVGSALFTQFVPVKSGKPLGEFNTLKEAQAISDEVVEQDYTACDGSNQTLVRETWHEMNQ
jgi:hypothetical protein